MKQVITKINEWAPVFMGLIMVFAPGTLSTGSIQAAGLYFLLSGLGVVFRIGKPNEHDNNQN